MKILVRFLLVPVLLFSLYSCSNDENETSPNQSKYTTYSAENPGSTDFYLADTETKVGQFSNSEFEIAAEIVGEFLRNDDGIKIRIDSVETMDTKKNHLKYLAIYGTSQEKDSGGHEFTRYHHIAFPIYDKPNYSTRGIDNNTCTSANPPYNCNHCDFDRDENGCIIGCKCNDLFGGTCLHSVSSSSIATPLSLSLVALF